MVRKLGGKFSDEMVASVLDSLEQRNLLSDARYAEQYLSMRLRKGYGPVRISNELRERGVDAELISLAFETAEIDWFEMLRQAHDRKYGQQIPSDYKEQARRARFLEYRGFYAEQIRELLFTP